MTTTDRLYAYCEACDTIVYREPGKRHGDGQQDADDAPVWLHYCERDNYDRQEPNDSLPIVRCGCTEH